MKTFMPKDHEVQRVWYVVDAKDKPAGRLAAELACVLRGKNKPIYTPHVDTGDFVVVVNAEKVKLTGNKEEKKIYKHYTGYVDGLRQFPARVVRAKNPRRIIMQAVKGMLPKNRLSRHVLKRLKVYVGENHPHVAQKPQALSLG